MRNYRFDNIKFILIVLVVLGHLLELLKDSATANSLYRVIYLFHMPAFIFISGYFAKFDPKKILHSLIYPYIILQAVYLPFHYLFILGKETVTLQFTSPYWILWYLMAMALYYLLIPFFQTQDLRRQILTLSAVVIVSLLAGYDSSIGYHMSLSRFFVFLPYFLAGLYFRTSQQRIMEKWRSRPQLHAVTYTVAFIGAAYSVFYILNTKLSSFVLYGSLHYAKLNYGPSTRLLLLFFATCWIILLLHAIPNKRISAISLIGKNTFPIFVLHGFFIELASKYNIFQYGEINNLLLVITLTGGILILLGNKNTARLMQLLFHCNQKKK